MLSLDYAETLDWFDWILRTQGLSMVRDEGVLGHLWELDVELWSR